MENINNYVCVKTYTLPDIRKKEVLRYAGVKESTPQIDDLVEECIDTAKDKFTPKACFIEVPVCFCENTVDFGFSKIQSENLQRNLVGCKSAIIFAATVGVEIDRMVAKYGSVLPSKSVVFQAIGAERIETLCDMFCSKIAQQKALINKKIRPRFSPGYGDLPLDFQRDIFSLLDCPRKIGLSLNNSLLMSPTKSVTAIVGIEDAKL